MNASGITREIDRLEQLAERLAQAYARRGDGS